MLQTHVIPHAVGMRECFRARGNGTGWRVARIMMLQVSPHRADVLQRPTTKGTPVTVLLMMIAYHLLLPVVSRAPLILGRGGVGGRRGGRRLVLLLLLLLLLLVVFL